MTTAIHVEFSRTCDAVDAFPTVCEHLDGAHLEDTSIEVTCAAAEETHVFEELELALDEWALSRELPFAPIPAGPHTLVVRPPGD